MFWIPSNAIYYLRQIGVILNGTKVFTELLFLRCMLYCLAILIISLNSYILLNTVLCYCILKISVALLVCMKYYNVIHVKVMPYMEVCCMSCVSCVCGNGPLEGGTTTISALYCTDTAAIKCRCVYSRMTMN